MKILLANKFYYCRGGDCIYTLNLEQLLKEHGHEVAVFAMDYPDNLDSKWKKYFPKNMNKLMAFTRPFGSCEVKRKFNALLNDFKPHIVHLNNIHPLPVLSVERGRCNRTRPSCYQFLCDAGMPCRILRAFLNP